MQEKTPSLAVELREKKDKNRTHHIPAILYGKGTTSVMVWVDFKKFNRLYNKIGESTILDLEIEGKKLPEKVLIYDIQRDPISGEFIHLDFYKVRMDEEIQTDVELKFVGVAPAVKELGGVFIQNMDQIEVKCLPKNLPSSITIDISSLKTFEDYIYAKDLNVGEGVELIVEPDTVVALISAPRSEKELEELNEDVDSDISKVEGIEKKESDEGEVESAAEEKAEPKQTS